MIDSKSTYVVKFVIFVILLNYLNFVKIVEKKMYNLNIPVMEKSNGAY